jgi:hypothetical protein
VHKSHAAYAARNGKEWTDLERAYVFSQILDKQFRVDAVSGEFTFVTAGTSTDWVREAAVFMGRTPDAVAMKASNLIGVFRNELTWSSAPAESDFLKRWGVLNDRQKSEVVTKFMMDRTAVRSLEVTAAMDPKRKTD